MRYLTVKCLAGRVDFEFGGGCVARTEISTSSAVVKQPARKFIPSPEAELSQIACGNEEAPQNGVNQGDSL
jgi:hypothetical protein